VARLSNKTEVSFEKALLATGANVRRLRADGADLDGIHYLRALGNSDAIREEVAGCERVLLVGGSYIGCEVAASLTAIGKSCTILMQEQVTFEHVFGAAVGRFFQGVLGSHGIELHGGEQLVRFEGDGRVAAAETAAGRRVECDLVVIGVGVTPEVTLARGAGLELGDGGGVRCSAQLETSAPGIYAAGDIAEYDSELWGPLRVEHWDVARTQAETVAANLAGNEVAHRELPYFFSDLADWASLEYVGRGSGDPVIRGSVEDGEFAAFYRDDQGRITAALSVERSDDLEHARRWISGRAAPDPGALADPDADLAEL
jgi:3-phenylpropionate/trans-cinnamate dioxygenase ferredoxin reductase subunit